jgi:hypothetical protein
MSRINRLLSLLVCALLISGGLALAVLSFLPRDWSTACTMLAASRWTMGLLPGILLMGLGALLMISEAPRHRRDRFLSFRNDGGAVNISTVAISEYLGKLAPEFPSVVKMFSEVEPHWRRIDIVVDVRIKAGPQLHEICEVLQKRVRESVETGLGIHDVRHVIVRVKEISIEHKTA